MDRMTSLLPSGITRRLTVATASLALGVVAILGFISYIYLWDLQEQDVRETLERQANRISLHTAQTLQMVSDSLSGLASNTLVINSLTDATGRERYLKPFFRTYMLPHGFPFHLRLYDRNSRLLTANYPAGTAGSERSRVVPGRVLSHGVPFAAIERNGELWVLLLAYPVISPATPYVDGALVMEVLLDEIFHGASGRLPEELTITFTANGTALWTLGGIPEAGSLSLIRDLPPLRPPLHDLQLAVSARISAELAASPLRRLTLIYIFLGAASFAATLLISRSLAQRTTRPLLDLHRAAERIAAGGPLDTAIEPRGNDEVSALGMTFNSMLARLRGSTELLEQRVRERTSALEEEKAFSDAVIDSLPGVFFAVDADGQVLRRNRGVDALLPDCAGQGRPVLLPDCARPEDRERVRNLLADAASRGIASAEISLLAHDSGSLPHLITAKGVAREDGPLIVCTGIDISDLKDIEARLRASEEKFRAIFARAGTGIAIIDMQRTIQEVNESFAQMLGYNVPELQGMNVSRISHAKDDAENIRHYNAMLRGEHDHFHMEKRYYRKDGSVMWGLLTVTLMLDADGSPQFIVGMTEDISARKVAEEELAALNRTLQQQIEEEVARSREKDRLMLIQSRQAAVGEMLGNIAHQWRQPLNALGLIVQDIEHAGQSGDLTREYLQRSVERAMDIVQHLSQTIDDFRSFFRSGGPQQTFHLHDVIRRVLSFVEGGFQAGRIDLRMDLDETLTAHGRPNDFAQVLLNILHNAREVLRDRAVAAPCVEVRLFRQDGRPVVTIADNGGGIPAGDLDHVFDPYFTTKEGSGGTGIGLYLSKTLVERNLGGSLTVRNTGTGAEFRVAL